MAAFAALAPIADLAIGSLLGGKGKTQTIDPLSPTVRARIDQLVGGIDPNSVTSEYGGPSLDILKMIEATSLEGLEKYANEILLGGKERGFLQDLVDPNQEQLNEDFTKGVEDPAIKSFTERILPEITARFGGNAAFGTDRATQEQRATEDLMQALVSGRANFLTNAKNLGLQAAGQITNDRTAGIAGLDAITNATPFSYDEFVRTQNQRLNALLGSANAGKQDSVVTQPNNDLALLGFLAGKALTSSSGG